MTQSERKKVGARVGGEGGVAHSLPSDSVTARNAPADPHFQFSFLPPEGYPLRSTHLFPHKTGTYEWEEEAETEGRRREECRNDVDKTQTRVGDLKRHRPEGVPTESEKHFGGDWGGWVRVEKSCRLDSDPAAFPFDSFRKVWDQTGGGGVVAEIVGGRTFVNMVGSVLHTEIAEGRTFVSMVGDVTYAGTVEGREFVSTGEFASPARHVNKTAFVSTAKMARSATSVLGMLPVNPLRQICAIRTAWQQSVCPAMSSSELTTRSANGGGVGDLGLGREECEVAEVHETGSAL
uniref:Uncharacterized protein n=1 Tax=Chromera velia CCMP2878 TaxID=1169474 RepID=A0A0G4FG77_9ALVE|eukprot:Cvel_16856.t1-p1 / transcript=Cvel_16856.t1 / gene=Cvel_16856 / organism=Chromera_velia_CCMP2878 / gene_product=hypothetical protein / transcript_product=hypothetical protein / location=Cvel_scaffold1318:11673-12696(+) / protein_length=291 / sequence_SO=supercontig / SO=protein_coding / is_pseudo=false